MTNKPSGTGSPKKSKQPKATRVFYRRNVGQRINNLKNGTSSKKRKIQISTRNTNGDFEKRLIYCAVVYALFLLTASILWILQCPQQVVVVLLVGPTVLIPPYLIPLRTRYTKVVYGFPILIGITVLFAVLSLDQKAVLEVLTHLLPIVSK